MAEDKKESSGGGGISNTDAIGGLIAIGILFVIAQRVYFALRSQFVTSGGLDTTNSFVEGLIDFTFWLKIFAVIISSVLLAGILHTRSRFIDLSKVEKEYYFPQGDSITRDIEHVVVENRWQRVMKHAETDNPNDWKVAILEADIMLDELLDRLGYRGDSMGEKMKQIEKSDFITLDKAWEAHKIRNAIAHEGSEFLINKREVLRVIGLYKEVFDEFYYI
ncbi:MAG: hypothetical protein COV34_00170 [Candidatus Zambryskibacteria bacterium CG10_big_fil_rev_8_21_14_0_10_42_12]|uniref:Uncharacterized protein n=1 Tax=Candidatus Zambryskibacteria bacterium CG10_big_fil_rev_8_21_14_0_10_42_12 TaxID=1975115 RepID=A0A2H0QX43_9BACT|nr:MAG: hypothetical protein COV34_00170 [Candidatus Zambryskibacteria bacterium CG10_big_fil_rev_8_21_14_0_10_42_12]